MYFYDVFIPVETAACVCDTKCDTLNCTCNTNCDG